MEVYVVSQVQWPYCRTENGITCLCQTRADAEEMVLAFTEDQPYDEYLDYMRRNPLRAPFVEDFLYDPLFDDNSDYFLNGVIEVLP